MMLVKILISIILEFEPVGVVVAAVVVEEVVMIGVTVVTFSPTTPTKVP